MSFNQSWWIFLILVISGYLFGSINFPIIISHYKKSDITKMGSGNPGSLNMIRNFGYKVGFLTLGLEIIKGFIPTLTAFLIFKNLKFTGSDLSLVGYNFDIADFAMIITGFAAVLGHVFSIYFNFKGGKGVATAIGVFLVINPVYAVIVTAVGIGFIFLTRLGSLFSLIMVTFLCAERIIHFVIKYPQSGVPFVIHLNLIFIALNLLIFFTHRKNLVRLVTGTEHKSYVLPERKV